MTEKGRNSCLDRAVPRQGAVPGPAGDPVMEEAGGGRGELNSEWFSRDGKAGLGSLPQSATPELLLLLWPETAVTPEGKTLSSLPGLLYGKAGLPQAFRTYGAHQLPALLEALPSRMASVCFLLKLCSPASIPLLQEASVITLAPCHFSHLSSGNFPLTPLPFI